MKSIKITLSALTFLVCSTTYTNWLSPSFNEQQHANTTCAIETLTREIDTLTQKQLDLKIAIQNFKIAPLPSALVVQDNIVATEHMDLWINQRNEHHKSIAILEQLKVDDVKMSDEIQKQTEKLQAQQHKLSKIQKSIDDNSLLNLENYRGTPEAAFLCCGLYIAAFTYICLKYNIHF